MRNSRSNFIPLPTKPARTLPKPLPRTFMGAKKSSSSQTERVVLIKEETLSLFPCSGFGSNDCGMRRDYVKAVNYINSVHKFINGIAEKNALDKTNLFVLPQIANFAPLFHLLIGKKAKQPANKRVSSTFQKSAPDEKITPRTPGKEKVEPSCKKDTEKPVNEKPTTPKSRNNEKNSNNDRKNQRKVKSNLVSPKTVIQDDTPDVIIVAGDCDNNEIIEISMNNDNHSSRESAVTNQITQFLTTLHGDLQKAEKRANSHPPKPQKCKNLHLIKERLEQLSSICEMKQTIESQPQPPAAPLTERIESTDCSIILSDADCEDFRKFPNKLVGSSSESTLLTATSSDIQSDSDLDITLNLKK